MIKRGISMPYGIICGVGMIKALKYLAIFFLLMVSCSIPLHIPKVSPAAAIGESIEGFRLYSGAIFVVKSEIIAGGNYWESSTRTPRRVRVWMEIYVAKNNRIVLYKIIRAKLIPAKPEAWDFKEFDSEIKK